MQKRLIKKPDWNASKSEALGLEKRAHSKQSCEQRIDLGNDPGLKSLGLSQTSSAQGILMKILLHPHYCKVQLWC